MKFNKILTVILSVIVLTGLLNVSVLAEGDGGIVADVSWYNSEDVQNEYTIGTSEELAGLAQLVNAGNNFSGKTIKLSADIDLENKEWTPIGTKDNTFNGMFDGTGKTISNLKVTSGESNVGLFGFTQNGWVKNISVSNAKIEGYLNVGVIAGTPYTSSYDNIKVTGLIEVDGYAYVGGMFGKNVYANVSNLLIDAEGESYVRAQSENYRTYVGGVMGFMGEGGHSVKNVKSNIDVYGSTCDIGGITGIAHYGNTFENCICTGDVYVDGYQDDGDQLESGGIAGVWHNQSGYTVTIKDCWFEGKISAVKADGTKYEGEFENGGVVGKAYSTTGTGELILTLLSAKIGDTYYKTLAQATDAAEALIEDGEESVTVTLLRDVVLSNREAGIEPAKNGIVYDLNGKNLILGGDHVITTDTTFKNGNILITDENVGTGVFWLWNSSNTVTFEEVNFANADENLNACSIFFAAPDSVGVTPVSDCGDFKFLNCKINLKNNIFNPDAGANLFYFQNGTSEVEIDGGTIDVSGFARGLQYGTYDIKDAEIKMNNMSGNCIRRAMGTIANSKLTFDGCENGIKLDSETTLTIDGDSVVIIKNAAEKVEDIKNGGELIIKSGKYSFDPADYVVDDFKAIFDEEEQLYLIIPAKVTITFNTNEGEEISPAVVDSNVLVDLSEYVPKKSGYTFMGWYADEELTEEVAEISLISDKTLYAAWKKKKSSGASLTGPLLSENEKKPQEKPSSSAPAQEDCITLQIGNKEADVFGNTHVNDVAPIIRNDRTMLPARFVAEALGAKVLWDADKREVSIKTDEITILITIDSDTSLVNGEEVKLDSAAFIENDRTYLPLRFIAESLGANVDYIENEQKIVIVKNK